MTKNLKKVLSEHHRKEMVGKVGGAAMCVCGQGCGSTVACGEYRELINRITIYELESQAVCTWEAKAETEYMTYHKNLWFRTKCKRANMEYRDDFIYCPNCGKRINLCLEE